MLSLSPLPRSLLVAIGTPSRLVVRDRSRVQRVDVVPRNVGDEVAVVTRFELVIEQTWRLSDTSASCYAHLPERAIPDAWLRGKQEPTVRIVSRRSLSMMQRTSPSS